MRHNAFTRGPVGRRLTTCGSESVANHAACLRGVRSRFFVRCSRISIRCQPNVPPELRPGSTNAMRTIPFYEITGRCSADAFPGSRADRGSCNRDSLRRRPARPAAVAPAVAAANPRGIARAGVALITAVVASTAGEHGQERRRGQNEKCMSHVRCFLFFSGSQAGLQRLGCGNWVETLGTTSGEITPRIQKNGKTALRRKTRNLECGNLLPLSAELCEA